MPPSPLYPTPQHEAAAQAITDFYAGDSSVDAVLLVGSCARGKASPDSCLDILVLARPEAYNANIRRWQRDWAHEVNRDPVYRELASVGAFSHVDLEWHNGTFDPAQHPHGYTSGADEFELEVGNYVAYARPLWERHTYFQELRRRWLPYYDDKLRRERLAMVTCYCRNNLAHIPLYAPRGLYFQCFKRLYHAFEEFQQALFIANRKYPIAYDKWVREGVEEVLGLPELYAQLPHILEIERFESDQVVEKARLLENLLDKYVKE